MKIAVDAGHGSNTAGKRTPPMPYAIDIDGDGKIDIKKGEQYREHYANVGVAYYLEQELKKCGFSTIRTGWNDKNASNDKDTSLTERQSTIKKEKCDYSVSIHFNAYGDGKTFNSAEGVGIYIHDKYPGKSEKLASTVLKYLLKGTTQKNRGVNKKSLAMCNCNSLGVKGAILVEVAFMTNEREATKLMANEKFWKESAVEICKGICDYTGVKYIANASSIPTKSITKSSSKNDIKWMQEKLNNVLSGESFIPLTVDGVYGNKSRIAVLIYLEKLKENADGKNDGWQIDQTIIDALEQKKTK